MKTLLDFFERTSEEYKSMKWLKDKIDDCDDDALTIHYYMILYNLVINSLKNNKQLETKINTYENAEDMALMFMWCDEKAKDKIKELQAKVNQLETNQDEVIKFIDNLHILQRSSYEYKKIKALLTGDNSKL